MKKKYIIIPIIVVIGILSVVSLFKTLSYKLTVLKIEKDLLSYYNLNKVDSIEDNSVEFEFYLNEPPSEYNITKLVNYYLSQLCDVKNNKKIDKETYYKENLWVQDKKYYYEQFAHNFSWYIQDENIDIDYATRELERVFIHKNNEWFITVDAVEKCDLPYGYYYVYNKRQFEKLDNVKKVTNVKFIEKINFDNPEFKKMHYDIEITYIDKNSIEQKQKRYAIYNKETKLWSAGLNKLYFNDDRKAVIRLCHHTYDYEKEEEESRINEEMAQEQKERREAEDKALEEQTGCHIEYKRIFANSSSIKLLYYFNEDRWEYKYIAHVMKKGGDLNEFMKTLKGELSFYLPYEEKMTIDEVTEKFLNDREQVKKALELWDIDLDKIHEEDIIKVIKDRTVQKND